VASFHLSAAKSSHVPIANAPVLPVPFFA